MFLFTLILTVVFFLKNETTSEIMLKEGNFTPFLAFCASYMFYAIWRLQKKNDYLNEYVTNQDYRQLLNLPYEIGGVNYKPRGTVFGWIINKIIFLGWVVMLVISFIYLLRY